MKATTSHFLLTSLILAACSLGASGGVPPPEGFTALFNGKDLNGWWGLTTENPAKWMALSPEKLAEKKKKSIEDIKKHWSIEGDVLVNDGHGLFLSTEKNYGDFELRLEYKTVAKADSGIYLRGVPQVQIWDTTKEGGKWKIGADKGSGGLWNNSKGAPGKDPLVLADKPFGEWNSVRIIMVGEIVTVYLNDKLVVDHARLENYFDRKGKVPATGPIQLQTHGGEIRWRNVFVREIGAVKVFILAGQSNMEGKAKNSLLEFQATDPKTAELFQPYRKGDAWVVRDDVFINYLERHGGLTVGYGSPDKTGVELEFGTMMGNHFDEPVLLIKAAWGGHSLHKPFRPPSAGLPPQEVLDEVVEKAKENAERARKKGRNAKPVPSMEEIKAGYGVSYRNMLKEVEEARANYETLFPSLKGKKLEMAGFVWFQGFNDKFGDHAPAEYASNMKHFIKDVRKDLGVPDLPFVIGALGQNGSKPAEGTTLAVRDAQLSMNEVPEFKGNVKAIRTDVLADKAAEALIQNWQDHVGEWEKVGSDRAYHYLGSAIWFNRIGHAFGDAMIELSGE